MLRFFDTREIALEALERVFAARLTAATDAAETSVRAILADVRERGDAAVLDYTRRWDFPRAERLRVPLEAIEAAAMRVRQDAALWETLNLAAERIRAFHEKQRRQSWFDATSTPGETLGQIIRPLGRVGVYVPGGTAAYPSTVLMTTIPALVAGVRSVALTTPPREDTGLPPDGTLAAAFLAGVQEIYAVGGAQAIGALAYGTDSIPRVDKIVGPGNVFVNLAKRLVFGTVGIDMLAGPSEVAVLADASADPETAAADILAQAEHDALASALVATPSRAFATAVTAALERQIQTLPRADIARRALQGNSYLVCTQTLEEAAEVISRYAPEHLHLDVAEPWGILGRIENAGAILLGPYTTASHGDYLVGPSHTLPTAGCARFASPLSVDDFVKRTSLLYLDRKAAERLAPDVARFADLEGLEAHRRAALRGAMPETEPPA
ncbi:MAG: histidinol dehydrogenase [Cytophagales bacterium]|nr:histidinol dehydrogenase [Armatimonadota bacterium]